MKKKIIAMTFLAVTLLSGCSSDGENKNGDNSSAQGEGPVKLTYAKMMNGTAASGVKGGQTPEENDYIDYLREEKNLDLTLAWSALEDDYSNKLSLNIAAGNLPDFFEVSDYDTFRQLVDNGIAADVTEAYNNKASELLKEYNESSGGRYNDAVTIDGKLYGISSGNMGYQQQILWLRADWLTNLGLEAPQTMEELEEVLRAFTEDDPDGNGADDTFGLTVNATKPVGDTNVGGVYGLDPIFYAMNAFPQQWMEDEKGDIYYGSTGENMKGALEILQKWYTNGYIDKQFPTRIGTGETLGTITSGNGGAFFGPWWSFPNDAAVLQQDWIPVNCPLDSEGKYNYVELSPFSHVFVVNQKCENYEAVVEAICASLDAGRGKDKEGYKILQDIANGNGVYVTPLGLWTTDYYDIVPKLGKACKQNVDNGEYEEYTGLTDYDKVEIENCRKWAVGEEKSEALQWSYYSRVLASNILQNKECNPISAAYYYTTESSANILPSLDKMEDEMYFKIITGEKSIDYFDEFVEQWFKLGGDTLTSEVKAAIGQ